MGYEKRENKKTNTTQERFGEHLFRRLNDIVTEWSRGSFQRRLALSFLSLSAELRARQLRYAATFRVLTPRLCIVDHPNPKRPKLFVPMKFLLSRRSG